MLKPSDSPIDSCNLLGKAPRFAFDFRGRNRRPPRDPSRDVVLVLYVAFQGFGNNGCIGGLDPFWVSFIRSDRVSRVGTRPNGAHFAL